MAWLGSSTWALNLSSNPPGVHFKVEKRSECVEQIPLDDRQYYVFGRTDKAHYTLAHKSISREHFAIVHHQNGAVLVVDLQSSRGTTLNGEPLPAQGMVPLKHGDRIQV